MKQCLSCDKYYNSSFPNCSSCHSAPAVMEGFTTYAPDLAHAGGGFKGSYFSDLARLEEANFWFQSRNEIILWALKEFALNFKSFLEIGCGTGFVLSGVAKNFPDASLSGSEIFIEGLPFARERLSSVNLMQMDARVIPFFEEFDVIGAFDVLEHIKEDDAVLTQLHKALRPDGTLILTVPQHDWLWSAVDEYAFHERRYSSKEIHEKVQAAGFKIVRSTSFISTLLPLMMVSRFFQKKRTEDFDPTVELKISPALNYLFSQMLKFELSAIKLGINLPVGGSRLVLAKKVSF